MRRGHHRHFVSRERCGFNRSTSQNCFWEPGLPVRALVHQLAAGSGFHPRGCPPARCDRPLARPDAREGGSRQAAGSSNGPQNGHDEGSRLVGQRPHSYSLCQQVWRRQSGIQRLEIQGSWKETTSLKLHAARGNRKMPEAGRLAKKGSSHFSGNTGWLDVWGGLRTPAPEPALPQKRHTRWRIPTCGSGRSTAKQRFNYGSAHRGRAAAPKKGQARRLALFCRQHIMPARSS